ncbi:hypothetical protein [Mariniblastus fucicola]|uniref:Uncharacterized protein n=1 Tax=Mariniblastus fucicola TaxID=980251 RepID=A0A5B9PDD0_9BACT|nr:hypothetical protein [Mariniblastus fucicola]QEG23100.1 hypothetical protein MFFC18_29950 [Mariniblastus fucicola]
MAKRPDISVILVTNDGVVRADFGKKSDLVFHVRDLVDVESSFTDAVNHVVKGKPPLAYKTIVASTEVWSQIVLLPRMSIGGIDSTELEEALKFEAETLSGIEIDEIVVASSAVGRQEDFEQYWVSAIRKTDLDAVNLMLESQGCRDIVVANPAGLSGGSRTGEADRSLEVWDGLGYLLGQDSNRLIKVRQFPNSAAETKGNTPAIKRFLGTNLEEVDTDQFSTVEDLAQETDFEQWALRVANNFATRLDQITAPLIRLTKGTTGTPIRHLASVAIAAAVLGFCFWHWSYVNASNQALLAEIATLKQPAEKKKLYDSQLISVLEQQSEIQQLDYSLGDDLIRVQFFLDNQSNRVAELLKLLVERRTPNLVVEKIAGTEEGIMISGISLNGEAAQAFAKGLREEVAPMGWAVNPAKQEGQQKLITGGPWTYEITLTDTGPFDSVALLRKAGTVE